MSCSITPRPIPARCAPAIPAPAAIRISLLRAVRHRGAKAIDVPFGEGQALVNLLGSRIERRRSSFRRAGLARQERRSAVLAVLGSKRDQVFPDVPNAERAGLCGDADMWRGIAVPKGVSKPVIAKLQDQFKRTVGSPPSRMPARRSASCRLIFG